ncbi:MAG: FRG domain-containing protein [Phycisphaerales bacterium]|nr:FRG domain-containing protein [Phycisphaerales bacterium]
MIQSDWSIPHVVRSPEELRDHLQALQPRRVVFRGQADVGWSLVPGIDHFAPSQVSMAARIAEEQELVHEFKERAPVHLPPYEASILRQCRTGDSIIPMTVMQHHGGPTRLLDWTNHAYVAAFFASRALPDTDGRITWLDVNVLTEAMRRQWRTLEWQDDKAEDIDLNPYIRSSTCPHFLSIVWLDNAFERAEHQGGLFTIGGPLGQPHCSLLRSLMPPGSWGSVAIPSGIKRNVMRLLVPEARHACEPPANGADAIGGQQRTRLLAQRRSQFN